MAISRALRRVPVALVFIACASCAPNSSSRTETRAGSVAADYEAVLRAEVQLREALERNEQHVIEGKRRVRAEIDFVRRFFECFPHAEAGFSYWLRDPDWKVYYAKAKAPQGFEVNLRMDVRLSDMTDAKALTTMKIHVHALPRSGGVAKDPWEDKSGTRNPMFPGQWILWPPAWTRFAEAGMPWPRLEEFSDLRK